MKEEDLRWNDGNGTKLTYIETLKAMCDFNGTFGGHWHSNDEWERIKLQVSNMNEEHAKRKVFEIEDEAQCRLQMWIHAQ